MRGWAPPGNFLEFYSFTVIQTGYWPDFNLESVFITKNIFIMKNVTYFRKTVETGVDPRQVPFNKAAPGLFKVLYFSAKSSIRDDFLKWVATDLGLLCRLFPLFPRYIFPARKSNLSYSQKLIPSKHKKSPIRKK